MNTGMNSSTPKLSVKNLNDHPVLYTDLAKKRKSEMVTSVACEHFDNSLIDVGASKHFNKANVKDSEDYSNNNSCYSSDCYNNQYNIKSLTSPVNSELYDSSKVYSPETRVWTPKPFRRSLLPHPILNAEHKQSRSFQEQPVSPPFEMNSYNHSPHPNQRRMHLKRKSDFSRDNFERTRPEFSSTISSLPRADFKDQSFDSSPHPSYRVMDSKRKSDCAENYVKRLRSTSPAVICSVPSGINDDELSRSIWQLYSERKQSEKVYEKKMALRSQLHDLLLTKFPNCGLYVVGSSMTGLGLDSSDMDMCLMLTDSMIDQKREAIKILHSIRFLFRKYRYIKECQVIYARVPILRFKDSISGIEIDLNINNAVGIRNTQLLLSYARIDKRLPPLVLLTKLWAQTYGINDAKNNTLSSYSLVLMVIHYLQYGCQPPVLPCLQKLQPDKYQPNSDVRTLKLHEDLPSFSSENQDDLGNLFIGFLEYFAKKYNYYKSVISVRLGCLLSREESNSSLASPDKPLHWKFLCIEEPFDLTNTARSVYKPEEFYYVRQVFQNSFNNIKKYGNIQCLL